MTRAGRGLNWITWCWSRAKIVEAKKVFAEVKARTPENSPVYRRIKDLEKTYE